MNSDRISVGNLQKPFKSRINDEKLPDQLRKKNDQSKQI